MAKQSQQPTESSAPSNPWQAMLDSLASGQNGPTFFLKGGRTRIRLVPEPGTEEDATPVFFTPVESQYRGRVRTKYLLSAVVLAAEGRDIPEEKVNKVIPVLVPKQVVSDILNALAEGWDLFDMENGHGISILKQGSGLNMEYSVNISPKPVALEDPEPMGMTLIEAAEEFKRIQAERSSNSGDEENSDDQSGGEEAQPAGKGRNRAKMGGAKKADW